MVRYALVPSACLGQWSQVPLTSVTFLLKAVANAFCMCLKASRAGLSPVSLPVTEKFCCCSKTLCTMLRSAQLSSKALISLWDTSSPCSILAK